MIDNIVKKIEKVMKEKKNEVVVEFEGTKYTYNDLDCVSYKIAVFLQSQDVSSEDIIAICMERSWFSLCTTIGIMRSGAAFLPIDLKTPIDRVEKILEISKAKLVISNSELDISKKNSVNIIDVISKEYKNIKLKSVDIKLSTLAYVIFTSGTTGEPKGVMIEHGGLCNHIYEKISLLDMDNNSVIVHNASIGFDISIWQILAPLCCGGKIIIFSEKTIIQVKKFIKKIEEEKVTILEVVPTYLNIIINECKKRTNNNNLKYVISTGQELNKTLVDRWFSVFPYIPIVNAYGPTEASDDIAHCLITKADKYVQIPIGMPINNAEFIIKPIPDIEKGGELWVSGICVGRGYLGNEKETKRYFLINEENGERIYKTGDLVSKSVDGKYYYHGRIDKQIKLHGNRIEISEIESCLLDFESINQVAVIFNKEKEQLCAAFTSEKNIDLEKIKKHLKQKLPYYMIPSMLVQLPEIPVDINGKTDIRELIRISDDSENVPEGNIEKDVYDIIKDIMEVKELPEEETWKNDMTIIGFESLAAIQLIVAIEEKYGFEFDEKFLHPDTIYNYNEICKYIHQQKKINNY